MEKGEAVASLGLRRCAGWQGRPTRRREEWMVVGGCFFVGGWRFAAFAVDWVMGGRFAICLSSCC
jgi:hypothetical protein